MMKKETEKQILAHVKKYAKELGLRPLRIAMRQGVETGWPDNLVFGPGKLLGLETKSPGKKATPMQLERAKTMIAYGHYWAKCDSKLDVEFTLTNFAKVCIGDPTISRNAFDIMKGV
jgi:hypothetical protein